MSVNQLTQYDAYIRYVDSAVSIWGQPCRAYIPLQNTTLGYENLSHELEKTTGVSNIANQFSVIDTLAYIDFQPKKSVFYHFNYFPADQEDLTLGYFKSNSEIRENTFIRTSVNGVASIWGDLVFQVSHVEEEGMYQLLRRVYFLKLVSDRQLHRLLSDVEEHYVK